MKIKASFMEENATALRLERGGVKQNPRVPVAGPSANRMCNRSAVIDITKHVAAPR